MLYPFKKIEPVKQAWTEGQHPRSCIGNCEIKPGVFGEYCNACGWVEH